MHPELRDFPISGIGGIETWEDAAEFLLLGAATLQVTTGSCSMDIGLET